MNAIIERINEIGGGFVEFALPMLIQSGVLILILLLVDLLLRKRVRAVFRYWIWMLVLVKLVLPTSLSSPVSVGRWFGDKLAYVDVNPAPEPLPEADVAPAPAPAPVPEIPPIVDLPPRIEAVRHTPEVVPAEPTIQRAEPAAAEPTGPPPPPAPAMPPLSWRGAAFLAWLGVLTIMALLLGQRALFVRRLVAQAGRANNSMAETLADCRGRMAVKAKVGLKVSGGAASPAVCGLLRPVILVPENLTPSLGSSELRVVLLHELAHIKRSDLWVNFAQTLLQIFYFYNPLLWLANAMIRRSREQAVDEMVLVAMGEKARQYPQTLVNVAKLAFKRPALSLRLIGVVESKSALTGRIKHILSRPIPKSAKLGIVGLLAVVIAAVFLLPMAKSELADRDLLIKFSDCLPGPVKTVGPGDKATWSTSYNVTFTEGEELFVVAELYQAGKPMRVLGRKVFRGSTDLERLSVHLTRAYGNEAKTVLMHSAKVQLGGQILDIPEFTVEADRFHYGEGWGRYGGLDLRRKRHQRTGREYARLENLFNWFNGSGGDPKEGQVYFWIPGRRINQTPSHHHIRFKMAPLSQLKHLTGYATAGRQGLDGKPIPDYLPEEQAAEMAEQYFMKLTMPLPELTAHKYYKVGDPIQIYVQERGSGKWKPTLGEIDHDGDVSPMFFLIDGREYASRTGFGPFGSGGHTLHLPGELYVDSGSFRLSPGRHTVAYGWKNLDVVNPDEPERAVHYDTLATDVVEFEVVEELPADYYFEVYEDGWEDILRRSIETPFTDDMKKYHISGPLLALQVGSLPFDIAFEIYAQAEGSEDRIFAGRIAWQANSKGSYIMGCDREVDELNWNTVGEKRWRLILVPSREVAMQRPPIRHYYGREFVTEWAAFEKSDRFEENRRRAYIHDTLDRNMPRYGGTVKADKPVDLDRLSGRWSGDANEAWPLPDGFELGWSPDDGGTLRINPDSNVRMLWLPEVNASLSQAAAETRQRLPELAESRITQINPPKGQRTLVAIRSSEGRDYYVTVSKVDETWANLSWWPARGVDDGPFGRVVDKERERGVRGATIVFSGLDTAEGKPKQRTTTSEGSGGFILPKMEPGESIHASISAPGFEKLESVWIKHLADGTYLPRDLIFELNRLGTTKIPAGGEGNNINRRRVIFLPDLETPDANTVLDLAVGQMLSAKGMEKDRQYFEKLGKGDLAYEHASNKATLLCLRGATMQVYTNEGIQSLTPDVPRQYFNGYFLDKVPCRYQITTAEGAKYEVKVLSVEEGDNGGANIEYSKAPGQAETVQADLQIKERAEEIADSFIKAIRKCNYSFLTEDEIAGLRREIRDFAGQHLHGRISDSEFKTLIAAVEKYKLRHVKPDDPVLQLYASEMGYFEFRDQVGTFKWLLWQALTREPQSPGEVIRRNAQHKWLKEFIKTVPVRPGDYVPAGIRRDEMYKWAEDALEQKFTNPLSLMSEAMTDAQFENFKEWMKRSSRNGLSNTVSDIRSRVIGARAHKHSDVEGVYQYPFDIELPFEDEVISTWGGPDSHLAFASNAQFRGSDVFLNTRGHSIFDVAGFSTMSVESGTNNEKLDEHFNQWAEQQNKGDLAYLHTDARLITLRGAKLAELKVANWFEADRLSNEELRESINYDGRTGISVETLPPMNGPFRLDTRIFIAVETAEEKLAVIALKNREFGQLYMRCRVRDISSTGHSSETGKRQEHVIRGRLRDEEGGPIEGARVALSSGAIGVQVSHGKLKPMLGNIESKIVETDSNGDFNLGQRPEGSFDLIVAHDKGFALVGSDDYLDSREIQLQRWGRIEGQVAKGRNTSGNKIWMAGMPNSTWLLHKRQYSYETECDTDGHFVFEKVPAGWFEVGYWARTGDSGWSPTCRTPVEVESGETAKMMLGGSGRPVIGRFVPPEGCDKPIYFGSGLRSLGTVRPERPRPDNYDQMTKRQQQQWYRQWRKTEGYKEYRDAVYLDKNWRQYTFRIKKDGSFRIEDVIAGEYEFTVWIEERPGRGGPPEEIGSYYGTIEVPEIPGGRSDEPLDLGDLELTMNDPLRAGDMAPLFEAKTLDGKDLKLIDYRGKFVLLSFWQPVFHPELDRLKLLAAGYNAVGRLEVIGLGGQDTLEEVKRYVKENEIPWPQIFTGQEFGSGVAKDYRLPGMPCIFLIGPDGRILATNLRAEKLSSTVLEALGTTIQYKPPAATDSDRAKPPVWITFLPRSPIRSLADYMHYQHVDPLESEGIVAQTCELEIRSAKDLTRVARVKYESYPLNKKEHRKGCGLNRQQMQQIGRLEDGDYLLALYANDIRCSNVAELTIDSDFRSSPGPVLELVRLPLGVGQKLPRIGMRVVGPGPVDPRLSQMGIMFTELVIDGITRRVGGAGGTGSNLIARPDLQLTTIFDLEYYHPAIMPGRTHEVKAILGKYESAPVTIPADGSLGRRWDAVAARRSSGEVLAATVTGIPGVRNESTQGVVAVNEKVRSQAADGLQVSIAFEKTTFALDEPIPVIWRIKNVSKENKTLIWHERHYSPVVFEIGKKGEKKYIREDGRRVFGDRHPGPPEKIVLRPGNVKEATFDLRYFGLQQQSGAYEVTGLYSPKDNRMLADMYLQKPEFKDVIDTRIDSATTEITLTQDLAWLKNELSTGIFHGRLTAARRLAPIIGGKDVLAELEKTYPASNTREMVRLVDHMAQFGDLSHVPEVLDMYEAGGYAPYWNDYGDDMLVFLLKWGGDRGITHLTQHLAAHKDTSKGTAEHRHKVRFLRALLKGSYGYFDFEPNDNSLPLLILALDEETVRDRTTLDSGTKVELRWCDSAALAIQKMLKQDWGFELELSEQERDGIIGRMREQLADRIPAIPQVEYPVQFKAIDFSHGGGSSQGLKLAVKPAKARFRSDEDIVLEFYIHNERAPHKLFCIYPDADWRWTSWKMRDDTGRWLDMPQRKHSRTQRPLSKKDFFAIPPGKTIYWQQTIRNEWLGKGGLPPGKYHFIISLNTEGKMNSMIPGYDEFCRKHHIEPWSGTPETGPIQLEIISEDEPGVGGGLKGQARTACRTPGELMDRFLELARAGDPAAGKLFAENVDPEVTRLLRWYGGQANCKEMTAEHKQMRAELLAGLTDERKHFYTKAGISPDLGDKATQVGPRAYARLSTPRWRGESRRKVLLMREDNDGTWKIAGLLNENSGLSASSDENYLNPWSPATHPAWGETTEYRISADDLAGGCYIDFDRPRLHRMTPGSNLTRATCVRLGIDGKCGSHEVVGGGGLIGIDLLVRKDGNFTWGFLTPLNVQLGPSMWYGLGSSVGGSTFFKTREGNIGVMVVSGDVNNYYIKFKTLNPACLGSPGTILRAVQADPRETTTQFLVGCLCRHGELDVSNLVRHPELIRKVKRHGVPFGPQRLDVVYASGGVALAVTSKFGGDDYRRFVLRLSKEANRWLVTDVQIEPKSQDGEALRNFLKEHPDARIFPSTERVGHRADVNLK